MVEPLHPHTLGQVQQRYSPYVSVADDPPLTPPGTFISIQCQSFPPAWSVLLGQNQKVCEINHAVKEIKWRY